MNIELSKTHSLTSDSHNWVIEENGRPKYFYNSIEGALIDCLQEQIKGSNARDIQSLIKSVENAKTSLIQALNNIQIKSKEGKK